MKSVKNILAMVALVTIMGVSSSYAGIYVTDRSISNNDTNVKSCGDKDNSGILVGDLGGILVGDFAAIGILVGDLADDTSVCTGDSANGGILVGD